MKLLNPFLYVRHFAHGLWTALLTFGVVHAASAGAPAQHPIIIGSSVKPIMMLNMSRDHQLFFKLYDDYSDITRADGGAADGEADITYNNNYDYYGYFDSDKCYTYDTTNGRFNPTAWRTKSTKSCDGTNDWSGNFLNWSTMTRVDAIRKILYGGTRVVDTAASGATAGVTVLERAFLPNDAHSFAKFYLPESNQVDELKKVVPDGAATAQGVTICNTTNPATRVNPANAASLALSQNVTEPPLMKVALGNYALWANNASWQCLWSEELLSSYTVTETVNGQNVTIPAGIMRQWDGSGGRNGNVPGQSGLNAASDSPRRAGVGYSPFNFNVRVQVCAPGYIAGTSEAALDYRTATDNEKCKQYSAGNIKPTGLLHKFGETDVIQFGLLTGSYSMNKSGGVLRKPVGSFANEVDLTTYDSSGSVTHTGTGQFKNPALGIVKVLDKLRIYGYSFGQSHGLYNISTATWDAVAVDATYSDNCSWFGFSGTTGGVSPNLRAYFKDDRCTNWGNPQAEMYLESLRYLAGKAAPTVAFNANDSTKIPGLVTASNADWADPILATPSGNYCAPLNVLQFNSSITSYDGDQLSGAADIGMTGANTPAALTKTVGDNEGITGNSYFVGKKVGGLDLGDENQLCTAKTISDLSTVNGVCPEGPRLEGGYQLAGLAYFARSVGLSPAGAEYPREKVRTFGVALAPAVPKVTITENGKTFTILPACRNLDSAEAINTTSTTYKKLESNCALVDFKIAQQYSSAAGGKMYVSWEDMEQGGDYDQDMWGVISYKVVGSKLEVTTDVVAQSAAPRMGFGYVVSGVEGGGFKVHSGINNFSMDGTGCTAAKKCNVGDAATVEPYELGDSTEKNLEDPLFYAAKWGGYSSELESKAGPSKLVETIKKRNVSDSYFYATDPRTLEKSLEQAFNNIAATVGASATVAANSTRLDGETYVYQARFNSEDWSGDVLAFKVNADGSVNTSGTPKWRAANTITRTGRNIYTHDGAVSRSLVNLTSSGIDAAPTLKEALKLSSETDYVKAQKRFNWLLGSAADESDVGLRKRDTILGDVVNADPAFAGAGNLRYRFLPKEYGSDLFPAFAKAKSEIDSGTKKRKWRSLLLVGSNGGMMHALDSETGAEVFAYVPRGVYSKLADLSSIQYRHQYSVDGPISVGDVYFDSDNDGVGGEWRTIAVGTLGAGGRGAYALDITDVLSSSTGKPKVIFDISAEDASLPYRDHLGFIMSRPLVVPTQGNNWRVIFGNGPNSNTGTSSLIAIDPENPNNYTVVDTDAKISATSKDNGLAGVALLPDGNGVTVTAYAGDIMGNMWKFDLSDPDNSKWKIGYGPATKKLPLVRVVDKAGVAQPITSTPTLGYNALKTRKSGSIDVPSTMVYFGTGKYYETTDPTNMQIQSVYAVADIESMEFKTNADRLSKLEEKVITSETASGSVLKRTVTNDATPASVWTNKFGWFIDLKLNSGVAKGERVISKPLLLFDRLIFATFIPSTNQCDYGGTGWLMELTGVGDKYVGKSVLGANANIQLDTVILGDLISLAAGDNLYILGSGLGGKKKTPEIISKLGNNFGDKGRISWQQLK
jgi:type IV pilus assembly protein PilY1